MPCGRLSGILTYRQRNDVVDGAYTYLLFGAAFRVLGRKRLWSRISARWTRLKLPLGCFVAGTLVSAGSGEQVAIENIRLGDRVETTSSHPRTRVPHSWMAAYLRLATDDGTGRVFHIGLLRPKTWFAAQGVSAPGDELFLELGELGATGRAVIQRIDESPHIGEGNGRLVLMTATHASNDVYELSFVEGGEALRGTGGHPLYSLDRDDWVSVRDLQVGERLQTAEGAVAVEALEKVRGEHRVYNLEVEGDHEYLVGEAGVRAHNTCVLDDEIIVFGSNNKPGNFKLRPGVDDRPIGGVTAPGKSGSIATDLEISSEFQQMFGRAAKRGDTMSGAFVGDIRAAGFDVVRAPTLRNPNHVRIISGTRTFDDEGIEWLSTAVDRLSRVRK